MHLRYARHTHALSPMIRFYTEVIGLDVLGSFENHDGYDGVFLSRNDLNWEIEFTVSDDLPNSIFGPDDALVFYVPTRAQLQEILKRAACLGISAVSNKNPYWNLHSHTLADPDGFPVILSMRSPSIVTAYPTTIRDWSTLVEHVRNLPYGRNANRTDFGLVLSEQKGSCSSKHAFLKTVAQSSGIEVQLMLGVYMMDKSNTPGIGDVLVQNGLDGIPEAHCYLKIEGRRFDFTSAHSDMEAVEKALITELEIAPNQVSDFKVDYHREFLQKWLTESGLGFTLDQIWDIRERCIVALSESRASDTQF